MVSGHLQDKSGYFYAVLGYKGFDGKRKTKRIATGLPIKGNKKKAELVLLELRQKFGVGPTAEDKTLFSDYLRNWLACVKPNLEITTYASYGNYIRKMGAYFDERGTTLTGVVASDIQGFYTYMLTECGLTANTVIHYHAIIRKSLQYAAKMGLIPANPALNVERPKMNKYVGSFYSVEEINALIEAVRGAPISLAVELAAFYGLRRSEIVGLKWDAIDFANKTISIRHTVTQASVDGEYRLVTKDRAKNASSMRSLPLVPVFEKSLRELRERQTECKRVCGKCYNYDYDGYVYVDELGELVKPELMAINHNIIPYNHIIIP